MKKKTGKQLSNPFSTGGGGPLFEAHVQASFVALMLTGGFVPCLPCWPITKIKLQGKFAGYDTDDLVVFIEHPGSCQSRRMLAQIKHSISITEKDNLFGAVIQAAWNDFNNAAVFTSNHDVITLITGPLSATDIDDVRTILEWARHMESAEEFFTNVELANFSSENKQKKLRAFRTQLKNANGGDPVADEVFFDFLKHFHLLGYDLDIKTGVTLSLLHSLIGQHSRDNAQNLWPRLVDEVHSANKNAGTIIQKDLPEDLREIFKQRPVETIPASLSSAQPRLEKTNWNQHAFAGDLAVANLLGAWNEKSDADREIIQQFISGDYDVWIGRLREILQLPDSPLALRNNTWNVKDRKLLWESLGARVFDSNLDTFKQCVVTVLTERDPQFDLPPGERFGASIYGKVLLHSGDIRKGMAESLALLGTRPKALINCPQHKADSTSILAVREIFTVADWKLWASLNNLLPTLAEAAPDEFLNAVETALHRKPCPFDELFAQEGDGIAGANYLTGLLWALESLAWDEIFLVRVCVILGYLASRDPGGTWSNRAANSLETILLPWLPQTTASIAKRKVALTTLAKEVPSVAWKLLLKLLPNQVRVSSGTHKPVWRGTIPADWKKGASQQEYLEQVSFCAERAVSITNHDIGKLKDLIRLLDNLPKPSFDQVLEFLSSDEITSKQADERLELWMGLTAFVSKHRRFPDATWALDDGAVANIEKLATKLAPENPLQLHRPLFNNDDFDLYEAHENWDEQRRNLAERRCKSIKDILAYGGANSVIDFAKSVQSPWKVGFSFGSVANAASDALMLPSLLGVEDKRLEQFVSSYVRSRQNKLGLAWVDDLGKSSWSLSQVAFFLSYLPFTNETWTRVTAWLGDAEKEYWTRTNADPYHMSGNFSHAIDKLIEFGRPRAALNCLDWIRHEKHTLDNARTVKALMAAVATEEPPNTMDGYRTGELIKALQDDPGTNPDDLFRVEWAYLPVLDHHRNASPKLLENRLASDSAFFCEVIRLIYRSKNEKKSKKERSEHEQSIATNARKLLNEWKTPPGTQADSSFSQERFKNWLQRTVDICAQSGHLEVALNQVGQVLFYCPADPQGLWIDQAVADALNNMDAEEMRRGFSMEACNSRGMQWVDPTGKPERDLAEQYRNKANEVENAGFQRFAVTLRKLAESYDRDAERILVEHCQRDIE